MKARQLSPRAATLVAAFADANRADEMKGGGDPADIPEIEAHLAKATNSLRKYVTRLERFREFALQKGVSQREEPGESIADDAKRFRWLDDADEETIKRVVHKGWKWGHDLRSVIDEEMKHK